MQTTTLARITALPLVVTTRRLRQAGLDPDLARRAAGAGSWTRLGPDAWLRRPGPAHRSHLVTAALALAGPGAALTGADACTALGLRDVPRQRDVAVLLPAGRRRGARPGITWLRTQDQVATLHHDGLPMAEPDRAVLDAARLSTDLRDVRALLCEAVRDGWTSVAAQRAALLTGPKRRRALVHSALDSVVEGARSAPECELADALRPAVAAGGLVVLLNPQVLINGELLCCPDAYVVGCALGVELDSRRHHGDPVDFEATLRRHDRAASRGLLLLHVTPRTLRSDPAAYRELVCAAVRARRTGGLREPAGLTVLPSGPPVAGTTAHRPVINAR